MPGYMDHPWQFKEVDFGIPTDLYGTIDIICRKTDDKLITMTATNPGNMVRKLSIAAHIVELHNKALEASNESH